MPFAGLLLGLLAPLVPALPAAAEGGTYEQVVELTLPADPRAGFGNDYHAGRSGGRVHKSTDLMGRKLWKLYAAVDGTICYQNGVDDPMPRWGYSLTLCGDDGRTYHYIHINNDQPGTDDGLGGPEWAYAPGIRRGVRVTRGQFVGYMGDSGNAEGTAPHLHFEIHDDTVTDPYGDHRINPFPSLQAARAAGRLPTDQGEGPMDGVLRVAGADRVGTAVTLSQRLHTAAAHVILAPAGSFPEAIAAGPLAAARDGVVLLTWGDRLDPRVAAEIGRLRPRGITMVGGQDLLRPEIGPDAAAAAGLPQSAVERLAGADRFGTAAAVAEAVWELGETTRSTPLRHDEDGDGEERPPAPRARDAILAVGDHPDPARAWPDALSASALGAATGTPVLFATLERLPAVTASALGRAQDLVIVGGPNAIGGPVESLAATFVTGNVRRVAGQDRYATSTAVADEIADRVGWSGSGWVWVATGSDWADAVTAGAEAARTRNPLILVDGHDLGGDGVAGRWLWRHGGRLNSAMVLGGTGVLSGKAAARVARRIS
jgi:putative cell wall-binding protein